MMRTNSLFGNLTRGTILSSILLLSASASSFASYGQEAKPSGNDVAAQTASLVFELQALAARAKRLDKSLARAAAEVEIADAVWVHDRNWAKELLREAYELTFPVEEERAKLRKTPVGAHPRWPNPANRTRETVRRRILQVAVRDSKFADGLGQLDLDQLGPGEAQSTYASLAHHALERDDQEAAGRYIRQSEDADPTQIAAAFEINQLAAKNRAAADELILDYIKRLRAFTFSRQNGSVPRTEFALFVLIRPESSPFMNGLSVAPPGPAVMRAYIAYMLDSVTQLAQADPGSLRASRILLLNNYPLLKQYAPELTPQFLDLEQLSRKPGESFSLPTAKSMEKKAREDYEKRMEKELASDQPDEHMIRSAISRGNFAKARKMIDKLTDRPLKTELAEYANAQEAISLANKGDILAAQGLAEKLAKATYILQAYPVIAGKCVATKDDLCARDSVSRAVKQLRKADTSPPIPPAGIPASVFAGSHEYDPILASLAKLAISVAYMKEGLALDVLDELVVAANHSEVDTSQGLTGFESSLFKKLADQDEARVTLAGLQLEDHLRQIVALAAIDQWKSERLVARAKLRKTENESAAKKN